MAKPTFSAQNTRVMVRLMKIVSDLSNGKINVSPSIYLKSKGEQTWLFSFLKKANMITDDLSWVGPDVKALQSKGLYNQFFHNLYNERLKYSKSIKGQIKSVVPKKIDETESEIIGLTPAGVNVKTIPMPVINLEDDGMYVIQVGKNKYRYIINSNSNSCTIYPMNQESEEEE